MTKKMNHAHHAPGTKLGAMIENIAALSDSLTTATGELVEYLTGVADELDEYPQTLASKKAAGQRELEELDTKIAAKTQTHKQIEASIKTLKDNQAAILKKLDEATAPRAA
jgi:hypothetical protein